MDTRNSLKNQIIDPNQNCTFYQLRILIIIEEYWSVFSHNGEKYPRFKNSE